MYYDRCARVVEKQKATSYFLRTSTTLNEDFVAVFPTNPYHTGNFHDSLVAFGDATGWFECLVDMIRGTVGEMFEQWKHVLEDQMKVVQDMIPPGWLMTKPSLMAENEECANVRNALLTNPHYMNIGAASAKLEATQSLCKKLNASCSAIDPSVVKDAWTVISEATETVGITYAIYVLTTKIQALKHLTIRRDQIDALREKVGTKGVVFGASLDSYATSLLKRPKPDSASEAAATVADSVDQAGASEEPPKKKLEVTPEESAGTDDNLDV